LDDIAVKVRQMLIANIDDHTRSGLQRYFKEPVKAHGVRTAKVNEIARSVYKEIKGLPKDELFRTCEELLSSGYTEEAFVVAHWTHRSSKRFSTEDLMVFHRWIDLYLDNWAKIDSFCNHTIGDMLTTHPELAFDVASWSGCPTSWTQRASAVSFILPARRGEFIDVAFAVADSLMDDRDDIVQKGYGWLLKEVSRMHRDEVLRYVIANKARMGRTALRYAIELMPGEMRHEAMKR